jgi:hypothetical protein
MSKFYGYKTFQVISNVINQLDFQGFLQIVGEKEKIAELITQELIQAGVFREYINSECPYPQNIHNTLEEFITEGGRAIYIHRMEFDENKGSFTLDLQFDPESFQIDKTLVFQGIQDFEETIEEEEDAINYVDLVIGLDQYSTKYVLKTVAREITFTSLIIPEVLPIKKQ